MANNSNRASIFEITTTFDEGSKGGTRQKTTTNVVINTNRLWYGKDSTVSAFLATAYDKQGNKVDSMEGYFLEPEVNYDCAEVAGGDKAIMYGTYNVVPRKYSWQRYKWYVDKVPGRSGIAIHRGNDGEDTEGCLMPGTDFYYDNNINDYKIKDSGNKEKELFDFFDKYGSNGIVINISV